MDGPDEIDSLMQSSYTMMMLTKQGEVHLDNMLSRAHRVATQISSMYKYEKLLQDMQDLTVNGSRRRLILNDLQRENKQIMALQDENRHLRETTEEYLSTIRDILESHSELENSIEIAKALKMQEMMDDLDKVRRTECQELQLAVQSNKNYKELFKMACFSNPSAVAVLKNALKMVENDILDEASEQINNLPENENMNDTIIQKP